MASSKQPRKIKLKWIISIIVALILAGGGIIAAAINRWPQPTNTPTAMPIVPSSTTVPTPTPTPTPTSAFDFENGTQGWRTSDSNTQLTVTTNPVYFGKLALEVNTQLPAPAFIEVAVYFNEVKPAGFDSLGPYDFLGKHISCFMYLPNDLAKEIFIQIFVKDTNSVLHHFAGTEYSQPYSIDPSRTGKWIEISYHVGTGTPAPTVNTKAVDAMGIRIETNKGSRLKFKGSLYIDDCTIKSQ
jgi:hypothetical protein